MAEVGQRGVEHEGEGSRDGSAKTGPKAGTHATKAAIDIRRNMPPIYKSDFIRWERRRFDRGIIQDARMF